MFNKESVTSRIRALLGGEKLALEVSDETISTLIDIAYDTIKPYITDTVYITRVFASVIDLSDMGISSIVRVYPAEPSIYTQEKMFDFEATKLDNRSIKRAILGSYPILDADINFKFIDNKLYLESDKVYTGTVTIEALHTPELEGLQDEKAQTWIRSYSLALTKQVCGRVRSKFKSTNVPVELDGDTLLSEAQQEIEKLEAELQDRQFGPFMILR